MKKEHSKIYQKLSLSKDQKYKFLIRLDKKNEADRSRGYFIAHEINKVEEKDCNVLLEEVLHMKKKIKLEK